MAEAATATEEAALTTDEDEEGGADGGEAFDAARAMATIKEQRKAENKLKADLKAANEKLTQYQTVEEQKADAEKDLNVKLAERDQALAAKDAEIANLHIRHDFMAEAISKGLQDPALAFLAAKEARLLGEYDPKEGTVSDHDWEELGEKFPSFKTSGVADSGDAGVRGRGKTTTAADQFNQAVRSVLR